MADTDPAALERKIERTRAELARTVDAIADRVSPKKVAERNVAKVKAQAGQMVTALGDLVLGSNGQAPAPSVNGHSPEETDQETWAEPTPLNFAPLLIGVGVVLAVGAAIVLTRRRRRR
ncbi:DUF3618 domain-containing protein [Acrocarpospora catenulata]|uniref:DUF3618 domain-containing protein n=1 Tax=Acrocarpospora catenulata TaxID=2836182 RepID=UPI001BDB1F72|nr:DUF3618 domain-containing protein [Acrocarpospora catenulata]